MIMCREVREIRIISAMKRCYKKMMFTLLAIATVTAVFCILQLMTGNFAEHCSVFGAITAVFVVVFLGYTFVFNIMKKMSSQFDSLVEFEGKCSQDMIKLIRRDRIVHEEVMWYLQDKSAEVRKQERQRYDELRERHLRIYLNENLKEYDAFKNLFFEKNDKGIIERFWELQKSNKQILSEEFQESKSASETLEHWWSEFDRQAKEIFALKNVS